MGRLRTNVDALEILSSNKQYIVEPNNHKGKWNKLFNNKNPIEIEIGSGKGNFIIENATNNSNKNFIAIDINKTILLKINRKIKNKKINNLVFFAYDARLLDQVFERNEIGKIYLNFSDPWPKKRHEKRRMTSLTFLSVYQKILRKNGLIELKTDNLKLFNYTIENLKLIKANIIFKTNDLHSEIDHENIMTEYEKKFSSMGVKINKVIFQFNKE